MKKKNISIKFRQIPNYRQKVMIKIPNKLKIFFNLFGILNSK